MKKLFLTIVIILVVIIIIIAVKIGDNMVKANDALKFNKDIENFYKDKTLYGADVVTLINKAMDNNKSYNVPKDENENYINDNVDTLNIDLILLKLSDKGEIIEVRYPMEKLEKSRT